MSNSIIASPLDVELDISFELDKMNRRIDTIIQQAVDEGDPEIALNAGYELVKVNELSGKGLARLVYKLWKVWDQFNWGDCFIDTVSTYFGKDAHTIDRYLKIPALLEAVPEEYVKAIEEKGTNLLIPVSNAVAQGYPLDDKDWESIIEAKTEAEVRRIIREDVKKAPPRANALNLYLHRDGSWDAFKGGERAYVGYLDLESDNPIVQQAIERITRNSGTLKE